MSKKEVLTREQQALARLLELPENRLCADCCTKAPKWASFNLGCFMCIDCSGIHRMIGTHVTKIKSTTLDKWEQPWVDVLTRVGNVRLNTVYEARLLDRNKKLRPSSTMDERERYIRAKYERREYYGPPTRDSLSRACKEMEMSIEQIPPGYMEGVDTSTSTRTSTTAGPAVTTDTSNAPMNPALLRRQQKKDAELAEARAAEEAVERAERERQEAITRAQAQAAAQAQAMADAQARLSAQQNSAALNDIFGASTVVPVAPNPVNSILSQFGSGVSPTSNSSNTGNSLFAGLSTSATTASQPVSGFSFTNSTPVTNPTASVDLFAGTTVGGTSSAFPSSFPSSTPAIATTEPPATTGFNFLSSTTTPNPTVPFTQSSVSGGDMFANLTTVNPIPTPVVSSFPSVPALPPPIFAPANNAATISSAFDDVPIMPEIVPVPVPPSVPVVPTPTPQEIIKPPPLHLHQTVSSSTPLSSTSNTNQQFNFSSYDNNQNTRGGNSYSGLTSYPPTTGTLTPSPDPSSALLPGIGNMGEAGTVLVQSVPHSELGSPATYRKLFSMPVPDTMDGIFVRQNIITQIHAKAASDLMAEFQSKQKALNEAFQTELQLLQNQLTKITNSTTASNNGRTSGVTNTVHMSMPVSAPVFPSFVPPAPAPAPVAAPTTANIFSGMSTTVEPTGNSSTSSGFSFVPPSSSPTETKRDIPTNPFVSSPAPAPNSSFPTGTILTNPFVSSSGSISSSISNEETSKPFADSFSSNFSTPPPLPEASKVSSPVASSSSNSSSSMFGGLSLPNTTDTTVLPPPVFETGASSSFTFPSSAPSTSSSSTTNMFAGLSSTSSSSTPSTTIPVNPLSTTTTSAVPITTTSTNKFTPYHATDDDDSPQGPPPAPPDEDDTVHTSAMSANAASVAALFQ